MQRISSLILGVLIVQLSALAAPVIYLGRDADRIERQAAMELQRYLYAVNRQLCGIKTAGTIALRAEGFVLGTPADLPDLGRPWPFGLEPPRDDGYLLHTVSDGDRAVIVIAAPTPAGVQNGVYGLLELWGFGFYLGEDTCPDSIPSIAAVAAEGLHVSKSPAFAIRGSLPWYNFFDSPTAWELADHKAFIDQLVRMRCNFVGFHTYDGEPFAAYEDQGKLVGGEPLINTSKSTWGTQPLATEDFFAGTGRYFNGEYFGAASSFIENREESIRAAKQVLRQAFEYAKTRGVKVCLGFELYGDPTDPEVQKRFEAGLKALLADYPMLDYVWLWEPEGMGLNPGGGPGPRSLWDSFANRWATAFSDVPDAERRAEAARLGLFALQTHQVLEAVSPDVRLVMSGWGGDDWLHVSDFFPGMDKILPGDVTFAALDNIRVSATVSKAYGAVAKDRPRWPIIWFEYDGDQWMPQPNLKEIAGACRDAVQKGCQGLLGIHWRTRAVEESATFCARFAWDPDLTVEAFCARRARDLFGPAKAETMARRLERLQDLGYRWVGGPGQSECGTFAWSVGEMAKREELATIAADLRKCLDETPPFPAAAIKGISKRAATLPGLLLGVGPNGRPPTPLRDLLAYVEYALAYDHAASQLVPGGNLDRLMEQGKTDEVVKWIRESRLAEALHTYALQIRNKGELGVLATINAKAWADLRGRHPLNAAALESLEALPAEYANKPLLLTLPDRVIVAGVPGRKLRVVMKARPLGRKRFESIDLPHMGGTTFSLTFPEKVATWGGIEYGLEVKGAKCGRLNWPTDFPAHTMTAALIEAAPSQRRPGPAPLAPQPVAIRHTVVPERFSIQLAWDTRPGEIYTVAVDGKPAGIVADGWFEDTMPHHGAMIHYGVTARNVASGQTACSELAVSFPDLPLPQSPREIKAAARANRIVLGWQSDAANAARYYIVKFNKEGKVVEETYIDADYGHYLAMSDQVDPGHEYAYTVAAVAPDGRIGPPSKKVTVVSSSEPLKPILRLDFSDEKFLQGLARVAEHALALGGRGWASLPPQNEWNPGHALTLSLWVKLDSLDGMPVLLCKGAWQQSGYFLQAFNRQVRFYLAGVDTLDAGALVTGKWQHLVATYGFNEMRVYINGELVGRRHVAGRPRSSTDPLLIGRYGANDDAYFVHGRMDDIRIYDVPLTPAEIATLYRETRRE